MLLQKEAELLLPAGFTSRPATMDDVADAVTLFNDCAVHSTGAPETSVANLEGEWKDPDFDLNRSTRLVFSPEGRLIGYIEVWDANPVPVTPWAWGRVHPDYEGQGIGTALMTWAEARAHEAFTRVPADAQVALRSSTLSTVKPGHRLFQKLGMQVVRHFWRMVIDLDEPPAPADWPAGLRMVTQAELGDLTAVYRATNDAFRDHWGHVEQPEEAGLRRWRNWTENDPAFDPAFWFLAMDGAEIAGVSLCRQQSYDDPDMGWVNTLGVRREWRRQGLGQALLQHSFAELYKLGRRRVGLGVDAASLTGATRLYEKAGMYVARQYDTYEKVLRPGRDLSLR